MWHLSTLTPIGGKSCGLPAYLGLGFSPPFTGRLQPFLVVFQLNLIDVRGVPSMGDEVGRVPARDPQDLERLLVSRERAGDVDGMAALYEPHAVLDCGDGRLTLGREAIRAVYSGLVATGRKFDF